MMCDLLQPFFSVVGKCEHRQVVKLRRVSDEFVDLLANMLQELSRIVGIGAV